MWADQMAGSVACGCGCALSWAASDDASRPQWHMLECSLPSERGIRSRRWHIAIRSAISKRIKNRAVVGAIMACWSTADGWIHTAAVDQSRGWRAPSMVEEVDSGATVSGILIIIIVIFVPFVVGLLFVISRPIIITVTRWRTVPSAPRGTGGALAALGRALRASSSVGTEGDVPWCQGWRLRSLVVIVILTFLVLFLFFR